MAIIRKKAMKDMDREDREKRLAEMRLELGKDRAQIAIGASPANPGRIREVKRTIARMITMNKLKEEKMLKQSLEEQTAKGRPSTRKEVVGAG